MAQTEHLPIYKAAYDVCLEQVVRKFYGYHKHALSREQRDRIEGYSLGTTCAMGRGGCWNSW